MIAVAREALLLLFCGQGTGGYGGVLPRRAWVGEARIQTKQKDAWYLNCDSCLGQQHLLSLRKKADEIAQPVPVN